MPMLPRTVQSHLEKAKSSALCAVENYNKPGFAFRTRLYAVLMVMAWTALLHAIFYRRGRKPWYVKSGQGRSIRYVKVNGEPKHWELSECIKQYWKGKSHAPERRNLEFMVDLRNKIEHRDHPELDPALYGECQAMLMNLEDLLVKEFGQQHALAENLGIALQFSELRPDYQAKALQRLQRSAAKDILKFIQSFRTGLPPEVLASSKYSLRVLLIPKLANRESAADLAVEFVPFDPLKPEEMAELEKLYTLIKEKQVPVASKGLLKPSEVVSRVKKVSAFHFTMHVHIKAWRYYSVRPVSGSTSPEKTKSQFCVFDELAQSYGYTEAWVNFLQRKLSDPSEYEKVTGWPQSREPADANTSG